MPAGRYALILSCPDRPGIVAAVTSALFESGANILEAHQFDVERVSHHDEPEALARKGRDIERRVLSRAVAWHLDGRVILNGRKTVVFRD